MDEDKDDVMVATHEGTTYVASVSLERELYDMRQALKYTQWVMWALVAAVCAGAGVFAVLVWLKIDTLVLIWRRLAV